MTDAPGTMLYATFTARQGSEIAVAGLLAELTAEVRGEAGNLRFEPFQALGEPRGFFVFEAYRDRDAFYQHLHATHTERFNDALSGLIEEPRSVLTWLHPLGASGTAEPTVLR